MIKRNIPPTYSIGRICHIYPSQLQVMTVMVMIIIKIMIRMIMQNSSFSVTTLQIMYDGHNASNPYNNFDTFELRKNILCLDFTLLSNPAAQNPTAQNQDAQNPTAKNPHDQFPGTGTTVFPLPGTFPWSAGVRGEEIKIIHLCGFY